ncbi:glycosyltransferase family 2 protein [Imhoffiella purpurea]|uniref:glycosyltransferase family 2 protein n=1 Tax=Imhoffiella purpurea TaxID=1249627 RepID=UPI0005C19ED8|nr:glycosyltransferase family 2 protein [Imhoffiella purpurea]
MESQSGAWKAGVAPVAVVMISLNEGHNMDAVCQNLCGWAEQVFLVDSFSKDETVDIALRYGVHVVQRPFRSYGDQWNFALSNLPISASWTMKLDPDERLSDELKKNLMSIFDQAAAYAISVKIRLWFMGRPLPVNMGLVRAWPTGFCSFSDVDVNEHAIVRASILHVPGFLEHHDSPDLEHWLEKQNRYSTAEAVVAYRKARLAFTPRLLGTAFERRMLIKKYFRYIPFRFFLFFLYNWILKGSWKSGRVGYMWARLRSDHMRFIEYKCREIELTGTLPIKRSYGSGKPDPRVPQYD